MMLWGVLRCAGIGEGWVMVEAVAVWGLRHVRLDSGVSTLSVLAT